MEETRITSATIRLEGEPRYFTAAGGGLDLGGSVILLADECGYRELAEAATKAADSLRDRRVGLPEIGQRVEWEGQPGTVVQLQPRIIFVDFDSGMEVAFSPEDFAASVKREQGVLAV